MKRVIASMCVMVWCTIGCASSHKAQDTPPTLTQTSIDSIEARHDQLIGTWHHAFALKRADMSAEQFSEGYLEAMDMMHVTELTLHAELTFFEDGTARERIFGETHMALFETMPDTEGFLQIYSLDLTTVIGVQLHRLADYTWRLERSEAGQIELVLSDLSRESRVDDVLIDGRSGLEVLQEAPLLEGQTKAEREHHSREFIEGVRRGQQASAQSTDTSGEMRAALAFPGQDRVELDNRLFKVLYARGEGALPAPTHGPLLTRKDLTGTWRTTYDYTQGGAHIPARRELPGEIPLGQFYAEVELVLGKDGVASERTATWLTFPLAPDAFQALDEGCALPEQASITMEIVTISRLGWSLLWQGDTYLLELPIYTMDQELGTALIDQVSIEQAFEDAPRDAGQTHAEQVACARAFEAMLKTKNTLHDEPAGERAFHRQLIDSKELRTRDKRGDFAWERVR